MLGVSRPEELHHDVPGGLGHEEWLVDPPGHSGELAGGGHAAEVDLANRHLGLDAFQVPPIKHVESRQHGARLDPAIRLRRAMFGFKEKAYFKADESASVAPKVNFTI